MAIISSARKSAPGASFKNIGDKVAGTIAEIAEYQVRDFETQEPKFYPKSGDPIMGVRITLRTDPNDWRSHVTLWAEKPLMIRAIRQAVQDEGAEDLEERGDLAVMLKGRAGLTMLWEAAYSRPEAEAA